MLQKLKNNKLWKNPWVESFGIALMILIAIGIFLGNIILIQYLLKNYTIFGLIFLVAEMTISFRFIIYMEKRR